MSERDLNTEIVPGIVQQNDLLFCNWLRDNGATFEKIGWPCTVSVYTNEAYGE
jgi:hypothetical protein